MGNVGAEALQGSGRVVSGGFMFIPLGLLAATARDQDLFLLWKAHEALLQPQAHVMTFSGSTCLWGLQAL